jgi:mono/diheme cytochrome c family protein
MRRCWLHVFVHAGCVALVLPAIASAQTRSPAPVVNEAAAGYRIFDAQCAWCHGASGEGGTGPNLHGRVCTAIPV